MENNSAKKLSRAAAILSLTAVLASMPVSAAMSVDAHETGANAWVRDDAPRVVVSISCEYGGDSVEDSSSSEDTYVSASIDVENYRLGELRSTTATAWIRGIEVAHDYCAVG